MMQKPLRPFHNLHQPHQTQSQELWERERERTTEKKKMEKRKKNGDKNETIITKKVSLLPLLVN